jgi:hypothetical protein
MEDYFEGGEKVNEWTVRSRVTVGEQPILAQTAESSRIIIKIEFGVCVLFL